jgi:O-antigen/teichoic acid export membrane protein
MPTSRNPYALSLKTNFSWTFIGNVVYAGCQWGMLVVLAKLGSPEIVGQYALGLAVTAPVMMLSNLQLRGVLATDAKGDYQFSEYLRLRVVTTVLALLAMGVIVALTGYRQQTVLVILAVALAKCIESISDIVYGFLQQQERMDRIAQSMMLRGALAMAALWVGVYFTGSVLLGVLGMAVTWAVILIVFDLPGLSKVPRKSSTIVLTPQAQIGLDWRRLLRLAIVAAPLGVVMMLVSLNDSIPRFVIQDSFGESSVGIFAAIAYLMVFGTTIVGALAQSATPRLAQYFAHGDIRQFRILMRKLIAVGAALGVAGILVAMVAGRPILRIFFQSDYADFADVLTWIMIAAAIRYLSWFFGCGLTAARQFKVQAPLCIVVVAVTAAASIILIPSHGLIGAAWATVLGAIAQLIGVGAMLSYVTRLQSEKVFS